MTMVRGPTACFRVPCCSRVSGAGGGGGGHNKGSQGFQQQMRRTSDIGLHSEQGPDTSYPTKPLHCVGTAYKDAPCVQMTITSMLASIMTLIHSSDSTHGPVAFGGRWTDAAGATDTSDVLYGHGLTADWTFGLARQPCGCAAIAQAMKAWAQNRIDELPHANGTFVVLQRHSNSTRWAAEVEHRSEGWCGEAFGHGANTCMTTECTFSGKPSPYHVSWMVLVA